MQILICKKNRSFKNFLLLKNSKFLNIVSTKTILRKWNRDTLQFLISFLKIENNLKIAVKQKILKKAAKTNRKFAIKQIKDFHLYVLAKQKKSVSYFAVITILQSKIFNRISNSLLNKDKVI